MNEFVSRWQADGAVAPDEQVAFMLTVEASVVARGYRMLREFGIEQIDAEIFAEQLRCKLARRLWKRKKKVWYLHYGGAKASTFLYRCTKRAAISELRASARYRNMVIPMDALPVTADGDTREIQVEDKTTSGSRVQDSLAARVDVSKLSLTPFEYDLLTMTLRELAPLYGLSVGKLHELRHVCLARVRKILQD